MKRLLLFILAALPSCAYIPRAASVPVKKITAGDPSSKELIVFLPGRWSLPTEFKREGFFEIAREKWPDARLVIPDLHLGYYKSNTMPRRLHEDVILPAKESGATTVRLVGISLGGLGALIYDLEHPGEVDEIYLLSPFLGEEEVIEEIRSAGGLGKWNPGEIEEKDFSSRLWVGLRETWRKNRKPPAVYLGCGREDRLAESNSLFAAEFLSEKDETWISGAHDWETWRKLFSAMIAEQ